LRQFPFLPCYIAIFPRLAVSVRHGNSPLGIERIAAEISDRSGAIARQVRF